MTKPENKSTRPTQVTLILRLMAGSYLVYLSVGLIQEIRNYTGWYQVLLIACALVFVLAGGAMGIWSLMKLIKGGFSQTTEAQEELEAEEEEPYEEQQIKTTEVISSEED